MALECDLCGAVCSKSDAFCTSCGQALDGNQSVERPIDLTPLIAGVGGLATLVLFAFVLFTFGDSFSVDEDTERVAGQIETEDGGEEETTAIDNEKVSEVKSLYVAATTNVRNAATANGSQILRKAGRGERITGQIILGEDGVSQWLKLTSDVGFISLTNLSELPRPKLAKIYDPEKTRLKLEKETSVWSWPSGDAELIDAVGAGKVVHLSGKTEGGALEVRLRKGGAGYIRPDEPSNSPSAQTSSQSNRLDELSRSCLIREIDGKDGRLWKALDSLGKHEVRKFEYNLRGIRVTEIARGDGNVSVLTVDTSHSIMQTLVTLGYRAQSFDIPLRRHSGFVGPGYVIFNMEGMRAESATVRDMSFLDDPFGENSAELPDTGVLVCQFGGSDYFEIR